MMEKYIQLPATDSRGFAAVEAVRFPAPGLQMEKTASLKSRISGYNPRMHRVELLLEIDRVRAVSRSKDSGPWVQWWDQMARKTVFRRLSKYLPMDAESEDLIRRDEEADTAEPPTLEAEAEPAAPALPAGKLDALEGEVVEEDEPTALETLVRKIEATTTNAEVDALLRGAKADITAMSDDERAQLETAVTAQRHGFSLGASK
jgi:hypothetical protein